MSSVSEKTARSSFWTAIERFSTLGVSMFVQIILARLLMPSDYGAIAMLTVFIGISQAITESGMTNALIRKQDCTEQDYSTAFFLNTGISIVLYLILYITAPFISDFYKMPILCPALRVYSFVFVFDGLKIVQYSKLAKALDFKSIAIVSSVSVAVSGLIGVLFAYVNFGVWALVAQVVSASFIYSIALYVRLKWLPTMSFNKDSFQYLWGFGSKMLLTGIISRIYSNIYNLVIGRFFTSSVLGVFNNGHKYANFYPALIDSIFIRNSLPIFSEYQDDGERLSELYAKFVRLVMFLTFPVCVLLFHLAKPLVLIVFTEKWIGMVPYLQIFAITALLIPANNISLNMMQVKGRTDLTLKAEIIKKTIGLLTVFALIPFGPIILAIGSSCITLFAYIINVYYARKVIGLSVKKQISDILQILIASLTSVIPVCFIDMMELSVIINILLSLFIYSLMYFLISYYVMHNEIYVPLILLVKSKIRKK